MVSNHCSVIVSLSRSVASAAQVSRETFGFNHQSLLQKLNEFGIFPQIVGLECLYLLTVPGRKIRFQRGIVIPGRKGENSLAGENNRVRGLGAQCPSKEFLAIPANATDTILEPRYR